MAKVYVLTHEYTDKSAFHVCGVTHNYTVATTWSRAADDNKVYAMDEDEIMEWSNGHKAWGEQ